MAFGFGVGWLVVFTSPSLLLVFEIAADRCECHACYHRSCFRTGSDCPRCCRLAERRERMARKNMEEQEDEGGGT
ncbi:unnamed protein product [Menidia menidia]|uniref:(Atlantic silverside) hypothetical protein n=1 Tax=Menidia menidia TaxID=238744 RepID=A0A8S4ALH6_9TELE|nr:unnamed protein product [Menidia menidia]